MSVWNSYFFNVVSSQSSTFLVSMRKHAPFHLSSVILFICSLKLSENNFSGWKLSDIKNLTLPQRLVPGCRTTKADLTALLLILWGFMVCSSCVSDLRRWSVVCTWGSSFVSSWLRWPERACCLRAGSPRSCSPRGSLRPNTSQPLRSESHDIQIPIVSSVRKLCSVKFNHALYHSLIFSVFPV